MEVIEEASNMLLIQTDSGLIQKPNNPRTRLKYGAGELIEYPELFTDNPPAEFIEFDSVYIKPTVNDGIYLTMFSGNGAEPPTIYQNSPALGLEYLEKVESYLTGEIDVDTFRDKLYTELTISNEDNSKPRLEIMKRWFEDIEGVSVTEEGIEINEEIKVMWDGVTIEKDRQPTQLVTEFYPTINFLYNTNLKSSWSGRNVEFTESEIAIIHRITRLYDKLVEESIEFFDTMTVTLPER